MQSADGRAKFLMRGTSIESPKVHPIVHARTFPPHRPTHSPDCLPSRRFSATTGQALLHAAEHVGGLRAGP